MRARLVESNCAENGEERVDCNREPGPARDVRGKGDRGKGDKEGGDLVRDANNEIGSFEL